MPYSGVKRKVKALLRKRYRLAHAKRARIVGQIRELLSARPEISFAYLHGSFQDKETFGDIDLVVFLSPLPKGTGIYYELALENALEELLHFPIDVRILNHAPLSFKYSVLRNGIRLFEKREDERAAFQEHTLSLYYDFAPLRERYLREALQP